MPGRKGQNRARLSKAKTGEEWFKGPIVGGTGFGAKPKPATASSTPKPITKTTTPPITKLTIPTTTSTSTTPKSSTTTTTAPAPTLSSIPPVKLPSSRLAVAESKLARPPIRIPKEGFERSVDVSALLAKSVNNETSTSEEIVKSKKRKKEKSSLSNEDSGSSESSSNGSSSSSTINSSSGGSEPRKRSRSPPPKKKVKAVDPRVGLIKKRKRKKEPSTAVGEEEADPVKRALRRQLKRIAKLAAIVTHKDPEVRQKVTGSFDRLIADFPMAAPMIAKWRELDNAKNRKLVVRCLQGLKSSIMRQLRELKVQSAQGEPDGPALAQPELIVDAADPKKKKKKAAAKLDTPPEIGNALEVSEPHLTLNFDDLTSNETMLVKHKKKNPHKPS